MYLTNIQLRNYGPARSFSHEMKFALDGRPLSLVLVGVNGSGKSILLSIILDALATMRAEIFEDAPDSKSGKYFKPISLATISSSAAEVGAEGKSSCAFRTSAANEIEFVELMVGANAEGIHICPEAVNIPSGHHRERFDQLGLAKYLIWDKARDSDELRNHIFAYFPAGRAERPNWLSNHVDVEFEIEKMYHDSAGYRLWRNNLLPGISSWLLDVYLDAELYDVRRATFEGDGINTVAMIPIPGPNRNIISHLNSILFDIIRASGRNFNRVRMGISSRGSGARTIQVLAENADGKEEVIAPNLFGLSTGELSVFCVFADIIRIAEMQGWNGDSIADIAGIVLIDEADLHLHIKLQKELLPKLIRQLPRVQFIMSTHSPFLCLGLDEQREQLISMPSGDLIAAQEYEEFGVAYQCFIEGDANYRYLYECALKEIQKSDRPLVVAEGKTDWRHLKNALEQLKAAGEYEELDLEFLEVDGDFGESELIKLFDSLEKVQSNRPIVCLFDRDVKNTVSRFEGVVRNGKVIGMCLSVPAHRADETSICIEHLYLDDTLRIPLPATEKRLRFKNEIGFAADKKTAFLRPTPGPRSIKIFDQDVASIGLEDGTKIGEFAISKGAFLEEIVMKTSPEKISFDGFRATFTAIFNALAASEQN